ncbi:hypothetical protein B296_00041490 [Ensete ventricosum]|uniref:Uncharacterized protein n=1 Tax=Ensete ventricosum TaxID=4639 RepID=A0A426ZLS0_ENSVE|nr:hypothetical protein B296_00041490 [Ensete ventricosum]
MRRKSDRRGPHDSGMGGGGMRLCSTWLEASGVFGCGRRDGDLSGLALSISFGVSVTLSSDERVSDAYVERRRSTFISTMSLDNCVDATADLIAKRYHL